jgi:DNA repair exonuclease SbcCD ATPase subunit
VVIQSIALRNFQKHKRLELEFDPHVTSITGKTGSGKSCLLRALSVALLNRPSGKFVRRKCKSGAYTITVRLDDRSVTRRRGRKANTYALDGRKYKAFGAGKVPDAVQDLTKTTALNFQGQHDQAYWFSLSPGQVSKCLNQIVNLSQIDRALDLAAKAARTSKARVDVTRERLAEAREEVKQLKWVEELAKDVRRLERKRADLAAVAIKRSALSAAVLGGQDAASTADLASQAILCGERAVVAGRRLAETRARRAALSDLIRKGRKLKKLSKTAVPDTDVLLTLRHDADKAAEDRRTLEYLVEQATQAVRDQCQIQERLDKARRKVKKLGKGKCPTCGRPMLSPSSAATSTCKKKHR